MSLQLCLGESRDLGAMRSKTSRGHVGTSAFCDLHLWSRIWIFGGEGSMPRPFPHSLGAGDLKQVGSALLVILDSSSCLVSFSIEPLWNHCQCLAPGQHSVSGG